METFDLQFRDLYFMSRSVSLSKVPIVDEPIPDPVPQAAPAPVPASVARKFINPKYALVTSGAHSLASSDQNSSNKNQNPTGLKIIKGRIKEIVEESPLHPGLAHLEKANMIPYLPTWPEPDPPSDVIGFINIRDDKRANQVHLQRSERFEFSQAIRFKAPLTLPAQTEDLTLNPARNARKPSGNTSPGSPPPVSPISQQTQKETSLVINEDQTDTTDSSREAQPLRTQDTRCKTDATPKDPLSSVKTDSHPTTKEVPASQIPAPPVPKRRTLQLVIDSPPEEQPGQTQVSLIKMADTDLLQSSDGSSGLKQMREELKQRHRRLTTKDEDSGSNEGSQDSTKVNCDRGAHDNPSSASTVSEEEFYEPHPESNDVLTNGGTTGSGRGRRHGDGVNMMARLSQSMLDLREPVQSEDSADLIRQSQKLRRETHPSPQRHIGQVRQTSVKYLQMFGFFAPKSGGLTFKIVFKPQ